jgi:hypothetical protein
MIALLFILVVTGLCVYLGSFFSDEYSWLAYYVGGNGGLLISALMLHFWNKKRRSEELKKK